MSSILANNEKLIKTNICVFILSNEKRTILLLKLYHGYKCIRKRAVGKYGVTTPVRQFPQQKVLQCFP